MTGNYASTWTLYAGAQINLQGTQIHSGSDTDSTIASVDWYDTLSTVGPGLFTEADQHRFTSNCGANDYREFTDRSLSVIRPTIAVPGGGAGPFAFWYLGGLAAFDGYTVTANFTGTSNVGACGGCSPTYLWQVIDKPGAVTFNNSSRTSPTLTSKQASSGGTYDVSVVFTADGFSSDKTWINLNTPKGVLSAGSTTLSNPDGCSNPTVYGGYNS
jgi:hypothetical protein